MKVQFKTKQQAKEYVGKVCVFFSVVRKIVTEIVMVNHCAELMNNQAVLYTESRGCIKVTKYSLISTVAYVLSCHFLKILWSLLFLIFLLLGFFGFYHRSWSLMEKMPE